MNHNARSEYKHDPENFILLKDTTYEGDELLPCLGPNNTKYRTDLINDTAQFNWYFYGQSRNICLGTIPNVDLKQKSLVIGKIYGTFGEKSKIGKQKILIDYQSKTILIKILVWDSIGSAGSEFYLGYIIPKIANDYVVKVEYVEIY